MISAEFKRHLRETIQIALPVIAGQLGTVAILIVDNAMVGRLGKAYLAAAGLGNSIFFLVYIFCIGLTMAITPLVGEAFGGGKTERTKNYFSTGLQINFVAGLLFSFISYLSVFLIPYLNQPYEIQVLAQDYLTVLSISILPGTLFLHYKQFQEGFGVVVPGMLVMALMVLFNLFFNWVFIYGNLGFPELKLQGAGYGTLISRVLGMLIIVFWTMKMKQFRTLVNLNRIFRWDKITALKIIKIGIPSGLQYFFEIGAFSGALIMVGWISTEAVAAHNVSIHLASISFLVATGISASATIRISQAKGAGDIEGIKLAATAAIILGAFFMSICALVFFFGRNVLPSLYIQDEEVLMLASTLMVIAAVFQISDGVQCVLVGVLRGLSDTKTPALITFFSYWIVALPVAWYLGFSLNLGMAGIWYALVLSLTTSALFLSIRFIKLSRAGFQN